MESNLQLFKRALSNGRLVAAEAFELTFSVAKLAFVSGNVAAVIVLGALSAVGLDGVPDKLEFFLLVWRSAFMLSLLFLAMIHRSPIMAWMREQRKKSDNEEHTNG